MFYDLNKGLEQYPEVGFVMCYQLCHGYHSGFSIACRITGPQHKILFECKLLKYTGQLKRDLEVLREGIAWEQFLWKKNKVLLLCHIHLPPSTRCEDSGWRGTWLSTSTRSW
jgi:hypothetical protein